MLFSELERENEDGDAYVYDVEDERTDRQPELNFTQQETQELVREMIGSLSDEQRLCILMYHLEGQSIRGIARTFGVSENTVKSRLLYGRKALKKKAEELQKQGWQLYGVAPVSLLMYLLLSEKGSKTVMADSYAARIEQESEILRHTGTNASVQKAGSSPARYLGNHASDQHAGAAFGQVSKETGKLRGTAAYSAETVTKQAAKQAAGQAIKKTGVRIIAGRVIAAVAALAVIGGAAAGVAIYRNRQIDETAQNQEAGVQEPSDPDGEDSPLAESESQPSGNTGTMAGVNPPDDQYPLLIAGSLSKADLEMVLAYGPQVIPEGELTDNEARDILNALAMAWDPAQNRRYIEPAVSVTGRPQGYVQSDMNRFFKAFSDYSFTEENDSDLEYGVNVEDGYIYFYPATLNYSAETQIHSMEYSAEEMRIRYSYHYILYPEATGVEEDYTVEKEAILAPVGNGQYRIRRIVEVQQDQSQAIEPEFVPVITNEAPEGAVSSGEGMVQTDVSFAAAYAPFLQSVENGEDIYGYYDAEKTTYTLADIDLDGIPELLLNEETLYDVFEGCKISVYDCDVNGVLQRIAGKQTAVNAIPVLEGKGFYLMDYERLKGVSCYYRTIIQDGKLLPFGSPDYEVSMGETNALADQYFEWHDVSDLDYLYSYGAE